MGAATALVLIAAGQPAAGSIALGASLARRRAAVRGRRRGRGPGQPEHRAAPTASPAPCSAPRTRCARPATSATGRCRGCRRSAGARRCARSPASAGGRCCSCSARRLRSARGRLRAARAARRRRRAARAAARPAAAAAPALARPLGLALRLQRGALIGWTAGLFLGGLSIGLTAQDADSILGDSKEVDELFAQAAGSLVDNYLAVSLLLDGADRHRLRDPGGPADARRGDRRAARAAARHRARPAALGRGLRRGRAPAAPWSCSPRAGSAPASPTPPTAATSAASPLLVGSVARARARRVGARRRSPSRCSGCCRGRRRPRGARSAACYLAGVPRPAARAAGLGHRPVAVHPRAAAAGGRLRRPARCSR